MFSVPFLDLQGIPGITINFHDAIASINDRRIVLLPIADPAGTHGPNSSMLHVINAECLIFHIDLLSIFIAFIQGRKFSRYFHDLII